MFHFLLLFILIFGCQADTGALCFSRPEVNGAINIAPVSVSAGDGAQNLEADSTVCLDVPSGRQPFQVEWRNIYREGMPRETLRGEVDVAAGKRAAFEVLPDESGSSYDGTWVLRTIHGNTKL